MASRVYYLNQLARLCGAHTSYYDVNRERKKASPESLIQTLRAMGVSIESLDDAADALRERRQSLWKRLVEPVAVAWDGDPNTFSIRVPAARASDSINCRLRLEDGQERTWSRKPGRLPLQESSEVEGARYAARQLKLPNSLPEGYHHLTVEFQGQLNECLLISAPLKAYAPAASPQGRAWGVFIPLYALHSKQSLGAGDFRDMQALLEWVNEKGGGVVATLPLLAAMLDEPFEPSPYAPASRLFWNEFYLDLSSIPEFKDNPAARAILDSAEFQKEVEALRSSPLVDYRRQMALKRRVLEEIARSFFARSSARRDELSRFVASHPYAEDYARFRAVGERQRTSWHAWPARLRDRGIKPGDYDEAASQYHIFAQWVAHHQIESLARKASESGPGLYLDLTLGVSADGYDVWREREVFALDAAGGAPPDSFFTRGQNWGFPPLHPEKMREQQYRYLIACLRHHLRSAGALRIDHVMWLHRLFWVPKGMEAKDGVYVRYPAEELYAILSLESRRHQAFIVGEDLGTVPPYVRPAMARHNIHGMYVVEYEARPDPQKALTAVLRRSVASVNTHDMPTFTAFWQGLDIDDRADLGLLSENQARQGHKQRQAIRKALTAFLRGKGLLKNKATPDAGAALRACLAYIAASPARIVLINLEDLWAETEPQNVPGTSEERTNWKRKARYPLEVFSQVPGVIETLREIDQLWRNKSRGAKTNDKTAE